MRRFVSLLLAFLVLLNVSGLLLLNFARTEYCRTQFRHLISSNTQFADKYLTKFYSGGADYFRINDDEIISEGKYYDIVKTEIVNGDKVFYAFSDEKESSLVKNISLLLHTHDNSAATSIVFFNFLNNYYENNKTAFSFELISFDIKTRKNIFFSIASSGSLLNLNTPPPEQSFS